MMETLIERQKMNGSSRNGHSLGISLENQAFIHERQLEWFSPWIAIKENRLRLKEMGKDYIILLGESPLPTEFGDWTYLEFGDWTTGQHHKLFVYGNSKNREQLEGSLLTRVHSACFTNEVMHAVNCECRKEWQESAKAIQGEGKGILVYLDQEGRGTGIAGKLDQLNGMFEWRDGKIEQRRDVITQERIDTDRAYKEAGWPSEIRDFTVAGEMLRYIGVTSVRLLTNNPKKITEIASAGIEVQPVSIHIEPDNEIIASDLASKRNNLGHNIPLEKCRVNGDKK